MMIVRANSTAADKDTFTRKCPAMALSDKRTAMRSSKSWPFFFGAPTQLIVAVGKQSTGI
jgi:hypothetical protein